MNALNDRISNTNILVRQQRFHHLTGDHAPLAFFRGCPDAFDARGKVHFCSLLRMWATFCGRRCRVVATTGGKRSVRPVFFMGFILNVNNTGIRLDYSTYFLRTDAQMGRITRSCTGSNQGRGTTVRTWGNVLAEIPRLSIWAGDEEPLLALVPIPIQGKWTNGLCPNKFGEGGWRPGKVGRTEKPTKKAESVTRNYNKDDVLWKQQ